MISYIPLIIRLFDSEKLVILAYLVGNFLLIRIHAST